MTAKKRDGHADSLRRGSRCTSRKRGFPSASWFPALGDGYDLYDTQDKIRLSFSYPTRAEAEYQCAYRNRQRDPDEANLARNG